MKKLNEYYFGMLSDKFKSFQTAIVLITANQYLLIVHILIATIYLMNLSFKGYTVVALVFILSLLIALYIFNKKYFKTRETEISVAWKKESQSVKSNYTRLIVLIIVITFILMIFNSEKFEKIF